MQAARRPTALALVASVIACAAYAQARPRELLMINTPYPPYVMPADHPVGPGIDVELASLALERIGVAVKISMVPFARGLFMLENGEAQLTTTLSVRDDRGAYLYWSTPYRTDVSYHFYVPADGAFIPRSIEELRGKTVGTVRGFFYPAPFAEDEAIRKLEAPDMPSLVAMGAARRFDAIIVNGIVGKYEIAVSGRAAQLTEAPFEIRSPDSRGTVFGFSKKAVAPDLVGAFNRELERLIADGTLRRITEKYLTQAARPAVQSGRP